jgi:hypothetical protein
MTILQRVKKVVNWLIFVEYAKNEVDLAGKLGYTKSSFSQITNGKVPLADKFIKKLCSVDENINEVWVVSGSGTMLKGGQSLSGDITIPKDVWTVIKMQSESLISKDKQIEELVSLLKRQIAEVKKTNVRKADNASFAVVSQ